MNTLEITDLQRILNNYESLKNELNTYFGTNIVFIPLILNGYFTLPFNHFLNAIENNIDSTRVFEIAWSGERKEFIPYGSAPNFEDINRYEENGANLENVINISKTYFLKSGAFYAGNKRIAQTVRRGLQL